MSKTKAPHNMTPPFMTNASETKEIKRLRDIVTNGLGDSELELVGLAAGLEGELLGVFQKKPPPED